MPREVRGEESDQLWDEEGMIEQLGMIRCGFVDDRMPRVGEPTPCDRRIIKHSRDLTERVDRRYRSAVQIGGTDRRLCLTTLVYSYS